MNKFKKISFSILLLLLVNPMNIFALTKTETIYANLSNNGNVKKSSVNSHLANIEEGDIYDYTELTNIKNLNGSEKFSKDSNNTITWKSTGKDIYYKGKISNDLPISVSVKYYLDGKEVNVKDIKGKSGSIDIVYSFTNNSYDSSSKMYTPFVVTLVSKISAKNNSNISISNGKVVSTGNNNMIMGIAAPGLYESTGISEFKGMNTLTLSYTTTSFSNNEVYLVSSPKLLDEIDLSKLDSISSLSSSLNTLQENMDLIDEGSTKLSDGVSTLSSGANQFLDGMKSASEGANQLDDGISQVSAGVSQVKAIVDIINKIVTNQATSAELSQIDSNLLAQLQQINTLISTNNATIEKLTSTNKTLKETYDNYSLGNFNSTAEVSAYFGSLGLSAEQISSLVQAKTMYETMYESNNSLIQLLQSNNYALVYGTSSLLTNISQALDQINSGVSQISAGSNSLSAGLTELYNKTSELVDGIVTVDESVKTISDGISKLNSEGISKLSSYGNTINNYSNKVKKLVNLSKNYNGFASNNADSTVFIYKVSK